MSTVTIGEAFARRRLKPGPDSTGRAGYAQGQFHAAKLGVDDALLSYVDRAGAVCIMPVFRDEDGEWFQKGVMIRATPNFAEHRSLPRSMKLTDDMLRTLQAKFNPVEEEEEENPPPGGKSDEGSSSQEGKESTNPPAPDAEAPKA
jgi:hypothetical protein